MASGRLGATLGRDEGSAYSIRSSRLATCSACLGGSGYPTLLSEALRQHLCLSDWRGIVGRAYGGSLDRPAIAGLGPLVLDVVGSGDVVSRQIVEQAGRSLVAMVGAVAWRLRLTDTVDLAGTEGVLSESSVLLAPLELRARQDVSGLRRIRPRLTPAMGAVLLARRLLDLGGLVDFIASQCRDAIGLELP